VTPVLEANDILPFANTFTPPRKVPESKRVWTLFDCGVPVFSTGLIPKRSIISVHAAFGKNTVSVTTAYLKDKILNDL